MSEQTQGKPGHAAEELGIFTFSSYTPDDHDRKVMKYVEKRRTQMDTPYRQQLVDMAAWAKSEYDSIPDERINNLDLFKTGLARAVINHRLVMLYDNPSEAVYKTTSANQHKIEILKQVDEHDKKVSRYPATHQQLERTAQIEGIAIGMLSWHEEFDGDVTVGYYSTLTEVIPIKDFYWDEAGVFLNGNAALTCNDAGYSRVLSMSQFRKEYAGVKYKNVDAVMPNIDIPSHVVWDDEWEKSKKTTNGDYVHIYVYKCKKFYKDGKFIDKEFHIANGVVVYDGEMQEPWINGEKWLPFFKIEGIPTGGFGGLGIPALIRHPQDALDRMLTMAEAQAELAVNPVLFYQTTGELLPDQIDYFPGAAYPYKGTGNGITNDLQFFQQPDITSGAQYIMNKMMEIITVVTGVDIQALLDTTDEKAIQTQNKREIQEKILKMSVLWNETHGWADMATIRLAYLQKNYPSLRIQRVVSPNNEFSEVIDYPQIEVDDYVVKESKIKGKTIKSLEKKSGAFSSLSITPDDLDFPCRVQVVSSQMASGIDTVKQNKWDKMLDSLARVPNIANEIDSSKIAKGTVKFAGFKNSEVLQDRLSEVDDDTHPARQEFKAILVSEMIPFVPITPEKYEPEEYLYVFKEMMKLPEYKKSPQRIKVQILERLQFHAMNFADPYFKEKQKQAKNQAVAQQTQMGAESGETLKAIGGSNEQPTSLAGRVKSKAAEIGDVTKKLKQ